MFIYKIILIAITSVFILSNLLNLNKKEDFVILGIFISYLVYFILS
jgi:hypothetical protein